MSEENTSVISPESTNTGPTVTDKAGELPDQAQSPETPGSGAPEGQSGPPEIEKQAKKDAAVPPGSGSDDKDAKSGYKGLTIKEEKNRRDQEQTPSPSSPIEPRRNPGRSLSKELAQKAKGTSLEEFENKLFQVRSSDSKKFVGNPTRRLIDPRNEGELLQFDATTVEGWVSKLESERFIVMRCPDEFVVYSAAFAAARSPQFNSFAKLELPFGSEAKISDVTLDYLCHPQIGSAVEIGAASGTVIVVFAYLADSDFFLQSLPTSPDRISYFHKALGSNKKILVVTTPGRLRIAQPNRSVSHIDVDFLPSLLRKHFPDTWNVLEQDLLQQFSKGLWGPKGDIEEFYYRVQIFLKNGTLEAEVQLRNQYVNRADPATAFQTRTAGPPAEVLRDDTPLENTVTFVATYFKRLSAADFQTVLLKLLGEQNVEITLPGPNPGAEIIRPKLLRQIWTERRQTVLTSCSLRPTGLPPVVEFNPIEIRDRLERDFESQFVFLWEDMYRGVESSGLLFDEKESVSDAVMRLTARRFKNNPDAQSDEFLARLILSAGNSAKHAEVGLERMREVFSGLNGSRRQHVMNRLGTLFNFLLEEKCDAVVDRQMKALLDAQCQGEALQLLPRLANSQYLEKKLFVLRRILNEGGESFREAGYRLLLEWALQGGWNSAALLKNVYAWCDGELSPSCHAAMQLLVHVSQWGMTPSSIGETHILASAFLAADPETRSVLIPWLLSLETGPGDWQQAEWKLGTALLAFLWIMPRPIPDDFLTSNHFLCACIQITWSIAFENFLQERLSDLQAQEQRDSFRALAVMDCAVALGADSATENASAVLHQIAESVAKMDPQKRASILAHCDAVAQALNECIEMASDVIGFLGDRKTIQAAKVMRERWTTITYRVRDLRNRVRQSSASARSARGGK